MTERSEPYHHGNLKAALLAAAFDLIQKKGIESLSLREIAQQAGVSHAAPYRHFKSKEDLLAALATESLQELTGAVRIAVDQEPDAALRLRVAARTYLRYALANPARFELTFHAPFDREAYPAYVAAYTDSLALLAKVIESRGESQGAHRVESTLASDLIWASVHGISELGLAKRLRHGDPQELEELAEAAVEAILQGLPEAG